MSRSSSPPIRRSGADSALSAIDSALAAHVVMCACGCERLVDETRPSVDFYSMPCSDFWHASQRRDNPEAWRAAVRAGTNDLDGNLALAELFDADPAPRFIEPRAGDEPSALDRLEPRPAPRRTVPAASEAERRGYTTTTIPEHRPSYHNPQDIVPHPVYRDEPEEEVSRLRRMLDRVLRPNRVPPPPAPDDPSWQVGAYGEGNRQVVTALIRNVVRDSALLSQLQMAQQQDDTRHYRLAQQSWSITYVDGSAFGDPGGGSTWRVDVGHLSEHVRVGPEESHHTVVTECVNRLRAQQNGRLE